MILNKPQAAAVYSAMCTLNDISAKVRAQLPGELYDLIEVRENIDGEVIVQCNPAYEIHATQNAFATAYGLN